MLEQDGRILLIKNGALQPTPFADLHATIMTAMGISPQTGFDIEGRPFYVTQDGHGKAVMDLFARG